MPLSSSAGIHAHRVCPQLEVDLITAFATCRFDPERLRDGVEHRNEQTTTDFRCWDTKRTCRRGLTMSVHRGGVERKARADGQYGAPEADIGRAG
jgi:hypothetical protein